jgi:hypothetical protein
MNTSEDAGNVNGAACDLLWGYDEIGRAIGRSGRQVEHLRRSGALKSLKKIGASWVASRTALLRELGVA